MRRLQGRERLRRALRGLVARRPVRRVLLGTAGGAAGRRVGHCAARARDACVLPQGHPQRQATRPAPHVLAQVASGVPAGHRLLHVE